ncbi:LLM class flavin-dependent oxidoreductase [Paracoccus benzoatiresistens]|uniref:LLM class flavin-dependent oxidoreductase n=1 Tax=Paracoccus benzoatiresistens TaxID=2997341 RepID=A0ABT4JBM1_9RHOB|nr:LLM class flavin-dependent oxidoreductase [Paracoccus sp. EF6]MCZ0963728.1 LLM class flavin-dependent oxidoreductase [Paracoccus sp. EF6]
MRINIVSGKDDTEAYSDGGETHRYGRTREFLHLVRRLWTERAVTHRSEHYNVANSAAEPGLTPQGDRLHPPLYFGGASAAAERVAAGEADLQLFWGEPRDGVAERIARLKALSRDLDRNRPPLQFGLRLTTFIRNTREQAWRDAEAKVTALARI